MRKNIRLRRKGWLLGTILLMFAFLFGCVFLDSYSVKQTLADGTQVDWVKAGEVATFTIDGNIDCKENDHNGVAFVVAILAPKSWKVRENTTMTYTTTVLSDGKTVLPMIPIPEATLPKNGGGLTWSDALMGRYGVGTNALNDMEWIAFQSKDLYDIMNGEKPVFKITIKCKTGMQNLKAHIGFFINHTDDGLSAGTDHCKQICSEECFEVVEGRGLVIDYCNPHFNKVEPLASLQDDYVTFSFLGATYSNDLVRADAVYMEAIAYTENGGVYSVKEKSEKTLMKKETSYSATCNLTVWPANYFGIPEGETISKIEYIFTNRDGSITITQSDDDEFVTGEDMEEGAEKEPFLYELLCE